MTKNLPAKIIDNPGKKKLKNMLKLWVLVGFWLVLPVSSINAQIQDLTINTTHTIFAGTTLEVNNLTVNDTLIIYGTLIVHGSLFTGNSSVLEANEGSSIFIFQDANLANQVTIDLSSFFIVLGNLNKEGSHNQGSLSLSGAHVYVFGDMNLPENGWEDFLLCSTGTYDGTTESLEEEACDAGQYDDFIENVDPDDLPEDLYQLILEKVNGCISPDIINPGDQIICGDYTLPEIVGSDLVNPRYYDKSQSMGGEEITGAISTTQAVWIYDEAAGGCFDEEQFYVIINPVPTANISGDATICDDGSPAFVKIDFTGKPSWKFTLQRNGSSDVTTDTISVSPYVFAVSESGIYSLTDISDNNCSGTASGAAVIIVNPIPSTGEIVPD